MTTLILRAVKGSPLTSSEVDANFTGLDLEKIQLGGDIGGSTSSPTVVKLRGRTLSSAVPTTGQAIVWNGSVWLPQTVSLDGSAGSSTVTSVVTSTVSNSVSSVVTSVATTVVSSTTTTFPIFGAYASNTELQTITAGSQQKVKFQVEEYDTAGCYDPTTSRFTPNVAGYYQMNAEIRFDGNPGTGNELLVCITKNGSEYRRGWNSTGVSPATNWFAMQISTMIYANGTTDYFEIFAQHGNSGSLTITGVNATNITYWNAFYVPYQLITAVSANTTVSSTAASTVGGAITSTVVTSSVAGGSGGNGTVTILNDISNRLNGRTRNFALKAGASTITEGLDYVDNKDLQVYIGGLALTPYVPQEEIHPWLPTIFIEHGKNTFRVSGSTLKLTTPPRGRQTAQIRINNKSASRQQRYRYPFSASTIMFGD